jgi:hypothetical protein
MIIDSALDSVLDAVIDSAIHSVLPRSTEDEGEEGEDQDDDDDEAAAIRPAAVDATLPLIPEFAVGAHFVLC